jgi:pimeloyl-ACP methyl ester carboxylesterase
VLETVINLLGPFDAIVSHSLGSFAALYTFYRKGSASVRELVITGTPGEVNEFLAYYQNTLGLSRRANRIIRQTFHRILDQTPDYYSARRFASVLDIPGLIIHDQEDRETPIHHAEAIHRVWPGSTMITTGGLGHNLRSPQVVKRIVDYLRPQPKTAPVQPLYTVQSLN